MSVLSIPNSFSPNTVIQSSQVNANYSAIATEYNSHAVQTDVAKTITVSHTFTASQTFSAGISVAAPITLTVSTSSIIPGITSFSIRDNANANDNLLIDNSGNATVRGAAIVNGTLTVNGATVVLNAPTAVKAASANISFLVQRTTSSPSTIELIAQDTQVRLRGYNVANDKDILIDTDSAGTTRVRIAGATGLVTLGNGLVVSASGATITGNSTITGNLNVTGTVTAVQGSNAYVRRTTDLNFTTSTDFGVAFAIGATEEWEFEYVLQHTNGSAATASFSVTGPAAATGFFGGFSTVSGAPSAVQGAVQQSLGNILVGFTMSATAGYTHIRGYAKGGGTPGNIAISGTASAGTGVLKAGSYVRYSRIA